MRDKVLYSIVLFAVLMIAASLLLGQLTAGQDVKIIKDLGLAAISLFGHFIAIFIGIGLVSKEVERRSIYALLAKPISRAELLARQVPRPGLDAAGQRRGDDGGAGRGARPSYGGTTPPELARRWEAPADRSDDRRWRRS